MSVVISDEKTMNFEFPTPKMNIQTYKDIKTWKSGDKLEPAEIMSKEEAHNKGLLHLSVHLLVIDSQNRILARKRKETEERYSGLWTTTIGTHVNEGENYLQTLGRLLPIKKRLEFYGEFRVRDEWENEINGLYVMHAEEEDLSADFLKDRRFFGKEELEMLSAARQTTPHIRGAMIKL